MDTSRLIIAIILSLGLVFAYQELVLKRLYPPPSKNAQPQNQTAALTGSPAASASMTAQGTASPSAGAAPSGANAAGPTTLAPAPSAGPEREVRLDTDLFSAVLTSRGARLKSLRLKNFKQTTHDQSPYEMIQPSSSGRLPLGVLIQIGGAPADDHLLDYTTNAPDQIDAHGNRDATVTFAGQTTDGIRIEKTFTFHANSYVFAMNVAASSPKPLDAIGIAMTEPLTERGEGYYDIPELQAYVDKTITENEKSLKKGVAPISGRVSYAGFGDRYFLSAYLPKAPASGVLKMEYAGDDASVRLLFPSATTVSADVYMGPKKLEILEAVNPALNKSIDFGWTGILALAFLRVLKIFHRFAPNWGWDIILMTLALRILMLPMSIRGQRSMLKMQRLQPQMERVRAQFKDDPDRMNKEMVDLYKRNHVNPLGGCAPMVIQLPVFIGLYEALLNAVDLRHAPFIWWIQDLSAPDCFPISWMPALPYIHCHGIPVLVLLMGVSAYLQQYMTPTQPDPNQQRMMMLSPLIFTIFLVNFPAGLSLYYFASNVLGIIQQYVLNREFQQSAPVT